MTAREFWEKWHDTARTHMPGCCETHCTCGREAMFSSREKDLRSVVPEAALNQKHPYR